MTLTALASLPSAPVGSVLPVELTWEGPLDGQQIVPVAAVEVGK